MVVGVQPEMGRMPPAHRRQVSRMARPIGIVDGVVLILVLAVGVMLRLWVLGHANMSSDEAVVGLMAQQIVHGHTYTFYWGQTYGGVEPYVVAVMRLFGSTPLVLNLTASVLSLAAAVLTWLVGRQIFSERAALVAGAIVWVWPEVNLWSSTREFGFRQIALVVGLLIVFVTYRLHSQDVALGGFAVYGALVGLGWWATPEILYFVIPTAPLVVVGAFKAHRERRTSVTLISAVAVVSFFLASLPWWYTSVTDHFKTLRNTSAPFGPDNTYLHRLQIFFSHVLPMLLGLRIEGSGNWLGGPVLGPLLYVLALIAIVGMASCAVNSTKKAIPLTAIAVAYPFIFAAFKATYFWNDARYGLFLPPFVALLTIGGLSALASIDHLRIISLLVMTGCLVTTVLALGETFPSFSVLQVVTHPIGSTDDLARSLAEAMEAHHLRAGYANYWIAYDTDYTSGGGVELSPPRSAARDLDIAQAVSRSDRVGYVFVTGSGLAEAGSEFGSTDLGLGSLTEQSLIASLQSDGVVYQVFDVGPLVVVSTARNAPPR
jgi:hypothetical protein